MGRLSHTNALLTSSGEPSRLKVILSTGLMTPTGVVTEGSHDASRAYYVYETEGFIDIFPQTAIITVITRNTISTER
jgi:hypothetical protein